MLRKIYYIYFYYLYYIFWNTYYNYNTNIILYSFWITFLETFNIKELCKIRQRCDTSSTGDQLVKHASGELFCLSAWKNVYCLACFGSSWQVLSFWQKLHIAPEYGCSWWRLAWEDISEKILKDERISDTVTGVE